MRILVVGGTGTVGRPTVQELIGRGHQVRVLSRHPDRPGDTSAGSAAPPDSAAPDTRITRVACDLTNGAGLMDAMDGIETVIDVSNVNTLKADVATQFFVETTTRLLTAEAAAGVRHHVLLSIVGVDLVANGYYQAKLAQEQAVATMADEAGVRWNVLRATQFHEFAGQMVERLRRGPVVPVPRMAVQPVSVGEVAAALADAVEEPAGGSGHLPDLAGPEAMTLPAMVRGVLQARAERALVLGIPLPGAAGRAMRSGALRPVTGRPHRCGAIRFREYLESLHADDGHADVGGTPRR